MDELLKKTIPELIKTLADKREALRAWRFGITGSKVKNMKEGRSMRRKLPECSRRYKFKVQKAKRKNKIR